MILTEYIFFDKRTIKISTQEYNTGNIKQDMHECCKDMLSILMMYRRLYRKYNKKESVELNEVIGIYEIMKEMEVL